MKDNSFGLNSWKKGDNLMEMVFPNPPGMADDGNALISRVVAIGRLFPDISLSFCEFPPRQFKKISK